jgi:prophage antirepressor-like protein
MKMTPPKEELRFFHLEIFGDLRVILDVNRNPWFVGEDIAKALGFIVQLDEINSILPLQHKLTFKPELVFNSVPNDLKAWKELPEQAEPNKEKVFTLSEQGLDYFLNHIVGNKTSLRLVK